MGEYKCFLSGGKDRVGGVAVVVGSKLQEDVAEVK